MFLEFRAEKKIIKNIKFKAETLSVYEDPHKWKIYDRVCSALVLKDE